MGTLLDLIAGLTPAPAPLASTAPLIEVASAPAANDPHQPVSEPPQAPDSPSPTATPAAEAASELPHAMCPAATATPEWREARDQYHNHIFACAGCHPPTGRYCQTGAALRAIYNTTPWN
ncbi:hypothetical protein PK34_13765 [Stutzerimonas stutzeri]|uniref:hypothetical protein n=1 Tax=Stutzerimonas stutzeri subgroup TaxID=578833 RepID=UPI0006276327|nr:hypothetical protein [Stutzerimonas kunmingensis]KKJ95569.1 hypothetical protein PK34_13765 [Stutzerimonas stutzeri]